MGACCARAGCGTSAPMGYCAQEEEDKLHRSRLQSQRGIGEVQGEGPPLDQEFAGAPPEPLGNSILETKKQLHPSHVPQPLPEESGPNAGLNFANDPAALNIEASKVIGTVSACTGTASVTCEGCDAPTTNSESKHNSIEPSCDTNSSLRARLVGLLSNKVLPDTSIRASSCHEDRSDHGFAQMQRSRLDVEVTCWCAKKHEDKELWIEWSFATPQMVAAVQTKGRANCDQWVTSYKLSYLVDDAVSAEWVWYEDGAVLDANTDQTTCVENSLTPFIARTVRLHIITYHEHPSLRADLLGRGDGPIAPPVNHSSESAHAHGDWDPALGPNPEEPRSSSRAVPCRLPVVKPVVVTSVEQYEELASTAVTDETIPKIMECVALTRFKDSADAPHFARVYAHYYEGNVQKAVQQLLVRYEWLDTVSNELQAIDLKSEYLMFRRGWDRLGHPVVYWNARAHSSKLRSPERTALVAAAAVEEALRTVQQQGLMKTTVVIWGPGGTEIHISMFMAVIRLLSKYYAGAIYRLLVFPVGARTTRIWNLVKNLPGFPQSVVHLVRFLEGGNQPPGLFEFIHPDQVPARFGGLDPFEMPERPSTKRN